SFNNAVKIGNKITGYIQDIFSRLYGVYYLEIDEETGEILTLLEQDIDINPNYMSIFAYNPEEEKFYGYGKVDNTMCFLSAPIWDPFNYTMIKKLSGKEMCLSMCYNPEEKAVIGVNLNYQLIKIGSDGQQTKIMDLGVQGGDTYVTGMVYSPRSKVYYWNINYVNGLSAMATIDAEAKKLDIYEKYPYCVEYYNLMTNDVYISDPKEPLSPTAGAPEFVKGSLEGFVPFTLPTETADGEELKGDLEYTTYLNGQPYETGKITISGNKDDEGNRVPTVFKANYSVPEEGKYSFSMRVKSNGIESPKASTYLWVGTDFPSNPANVKLSKIKAGADVKPGSYEVTWDAVTTGANAGYLDLENLVYKVKINGKEYTCSDNRLNVILPADEDLRAYSAEVQAVCNGFESKWISSNVVTEGVSLTLPALVIPTPDQFAMSVVIDNNKDGRTWSLKQSKDEENPYYIMSDFSTSVTDPMDDWYFLPKMKIEDTSKFHTFSMDIALSATYFSNEYVEVLLCDAPDTNAVVDTIIKTYKPTGIEFENAKGLFRVAEAGEYYIALRCTSIARMMGIKARNFLVEESDSNHDTPAAVEDITVTPGRKGDLKAVMTFHMPSKNIVNEDFAAGTMLEATISSPVESKT
ncbi:MAG: hypothetical protein K2H49_07715, partial [Muribaculaceae bacterium]|nr:hypothetical protein [Muribaculaceae bacterium]